MNKVARLSAFVFLLSYFSVAQQPSTSPSAEEYAVMGAMLDGFHDAGRASHPIVADYTATFDCNSICNGMKVSGCNGLALNDETSEQRLTIVKRDLPDLDQTTIPDFEAKNRHCSKIADKIPSQSPFFLFGNDHPQKLPAGWEKADFFYFSRVGFNAQRTQALVNVSFMSGTDGTRSGGKYFLLRHENGKWIPVESSIVWQLTSR
jgi:hypothetical protein